ncbi:MAG TPA: DUF5127 domain-containing protein, partial [Niastella sp.]
MKNTVLSFVFLFISGIVSAQLHKAPAYPLITHDPYFSIWSFNDTLTAAPTKHWTGAEQPLTGWVWVDKQPFRFMGQNSFPVAQQQEVTITATRTSYRFVCGPVNLTLQFTSPLLLKNRTVLTRPVSYITITLQSNDGKAHEAQVALGVSTNLCVNKPEQEVTAKKYVTPDGLQVIKAGSVEQPVLQKKGDDLRIDWGYLYVAAPKAANTTQNISADKDVVINDGSPDPVTGKRLTMGTFLPEIQANTKPQEQFIML